MILITDTSPLISLLLLQQIELLDQLLVEYYLPQAVWEELQLHNEIAAFQVELEKLSARVKQTTSIYLPVTGIDKGFASPFSRLT